MYISSSYHVITIICNTHHTHRMGILARRDGLAGLGFDRALLDRARILPKNAASGLRKPCRSYMQGTTLIISLGTVS